MLRIAYITGLLLIVFPSCKNAEEGIEETLPVNHTIAANFKNTQIPLDSLLLLLKDDDIKRVYRTRGYASLWHNQEDRAALLKVIQEVEIDGLSSEDYNLSAIKNFEAKADVSFEESVEFDILLTETFNKLAAHLFRGKINPSEVYPDWDLKTKELDVNKLLTEALETHRIEEALNDCRPKHAIYSSLRNGLKYLMTLPDDSAFEELIYKKPIVLNEADSIIIPQIKKRLAYWNDLNLTDTTDALYDTNVEKAVKKFQQRHGISPHGKIDSITIAQLNVPKHKRVEQVIVNLERWKWFAYNFGEKAVLVNIPDFQLAVLEQNDTVHLHKVIVGKVDRRTPVLQSKFYSIIINPTWTVPPTIIKEDLTPAALEDPEYFAKHNMTIYDSKNRKVDPYVWDFTRADSYRYVQGPGPKNALGEIKFNFGNKRSVYLHDTSSRKLFKNSYRALSSGCVRVENPQKLAAYMLKEDKKNKLSEDKINEMIKQRETKTINLKKSIHVHQLYWTAWMDKNGLQFRHDVYDLDNALYNKLVTQKVSTPVYSSLKDDR